MIGRLKKTSTRDVHGKKITRISIDLPRQELLGSDVDGEGIEEFLHSNVGDLVGFDVTALEDQDQEVIMENYDKV